MICRHQTAQSSPNRTIDRSTRHAMATAASAAIRSARNPVECRRITPAGYPGATDPRNGTERPVSGCDRAPRHDASRSWSRCSPGLAVDSAALSHRCREAAPLPAPASRRGGHAKGPELGIGIEWRRLRHDPRPAKTARASAMPSRTARRRVSLESLLPLGRTSPSGSADDRDSIGISPALPAIVVGTPSATSHVKTDPRCGSPGTRSSPGAKRRYRNG